LVGWRGKIESRLAGSYWPFVGKPAAQQMDASNSGNKAKLLRM
jgi:hypothetical protein